MEWSGVEWSGVEWSGVEWSGVTVFYSTQLNYILIASWLPAPTCEPPPPDKMLYQAADCSKIPTGTHTTQTQPHVAEIAIL